MMSVTDYLYWMCRLNGIVTEYLSHVDDNIVSDSIWRVSWCKMIENRQNICWIYQTLYFHKNWITNWWKKQDKEMLKAKDRFFVRQLLMRKFDIFDKAFDVWIRKLSKISICSSENVTERICFHWIVKRRKKNIY